MKLLEHKNKISWSLADKSLFAIFALVTIMQVNATTPEVWGIFAVLLGLNNAILTISDAVALVNILQFGINEDDAPRVNLFALLLHSGIVLILPIILFLLKDIIAAQFYNPEDMVLVLSILPIFNLSALIRYYCLKFIYKYSLMNRLFFINLAYFFPITILTILAKYYYFIDLSFSDFVYMYIFGNVISSIVALALTFKKIKIGKKGNVGFKEMMNFSVPLLFTQFFHSLPKQLDSVFILLFFDKGINGIYNTAKTFFRVFEESLNAAQGLLYPAFIRRINKVDIPGLKNMISKATSLMLLSFFGIFIVVQFGLVDYLFAQFIDTKFLPAASMFRTMSYAALLLPYFILTSLINAKLKSKLLLKYVVISSVLFTISMLIIGNIGNADLLPFAYTIYVTSLSLLSLSYYRSTYGYTLRDVFRVVYDAKAMIKK